MRLIARICKRAAIWMRIQRKADTRGPVATKNDLKRLPLDGDVRVLAAHVTAWDVAQTPGDTSLPFVFCDSAGKTLAIIIPGGLQ